MTDYTSRFVRLRSDQFEDQMIERGSELIYRLSGDDAKVVGDLGEIDFLDSENERGGISMKITPESITTTKRIQEGPLIGCNILNVMIGPR